MIHQNISEIWIEYENYTENNYLSDYQGITLAGKYVMLK